MTLIDLGRVHTTQKEFKNATITGHFGFVFEENLVRQITWQYRDANVFRPHENEKTPYPLWKSFRKASFTWRISVDGRPNRRNKAAFLVTD